MHHHKVKLSFREFQLFRDYISQICGMYMNEENGYLVENRLNPLLTEYDCSSFSDFYNKYLVNNVQPQIKTKIIDLITAHRSAWFGEKYPWELIKNMLIPDLLSLINSENERKVNIWLVGCSTGEEAYSLAMLFAEAIPVALHKQVRYFASDVSPSALFMAMSGRYDSFSVSHGVPRNLLDKYFDVQESFSEVNAQIKKLIKFKRLNIIDSLESIPMADIVIINGVLEYFAPPIRQKLIMDLIAKLNTEGRLLVNSHIENVFLGKYLNFYETPDGNYWQK